MKRGPVSLVASFDNESQPCKTSSSSPGTFVGADHIYSGILLSLSHGNGKWDLVLPILCSNHTFVWKYKGKMHPGFWANLDSLPAGLGPVVGSSSS